MNIAKPEKQDLAAAWNLIRMIDNVSYELNPLKPAGDGDYEWLEDKDKAAVLDAVIEAYDNCNLGWLMTALETLLSPINGIVNQEAYTLEFHPRLKACLDGLQEGKES
ncbi:hypothetical protein CRG49_011140 [Neisseria sp. N95_16]|uniref:Uncharacterized protein n=1 Tax=Neisseria brasiliensis TaxID=2666100 RepID=A0A5Q3S5Y1_9NEIS|nr:MULTISPECIES: hypothetical protein [Neisseria]MRN38961.1 hypothetical protein [Neisseria brasiliensis]MRN39160.1 hypothetical protein [Neisseria brasiliensis]PJO08777.1 hypothetical protein CRG49_011140 [Neisseria sp. N95_16]PJO78443.1 hypothetical protein CWC45_05085 [Neisseria sp. N177_16]QGL26064.1 hypothetical protein GJV52_11295 [Neisseria brasiliensis]